MILKILGGVLLFFSSFLFGISMSQKLKKRSDSLFCIRLAVEKIKNQIRSANDDVTVIFNSAFSNIDDIRITNNKLTITSNCLTKEDKDIVFEFFKALGTSDIKGECEKIEIFDSIIDKQYLLAKREYEQKDKIYKTFGVCIGLALAIFAF